MRARDDGARGDALLPRAPGRPRRGPRRARDRARRRRSSGLEELGAARRSDPSAASRCDSRPSRASSSRSGPIRAIVRGLPLLPRAAWRPRARRRRDQRGAGLRADRAGGRRLPAARRRSGDPPERRRARPWRRSPSASGRRPRTTSRSSGTLRDPTGGRRARALSQRHPARAPHRPTRRRGTRAGSMNLIVNGAPMTCANGTTLERDRPDRGRHRAGRRGLHRPRGRPALDVVERRAALRARASRCSLPQRGAERVIASVGSAEAEMVDCARWRAHRAELEELEARWTFRI